MKQNIFVKFILTVFSFFSVSIYCLEGKRSNPLINNFLKLPDQNFYWQGWVKYFHYNNITSFNKPKSFFQNNEFFRQRILNYNMNKGDIYGLMRIPSKQHFFLVLHSDSLNFYSSRYRILQRSFDSLKLDFINLVPEDKPLMGGIKDLGNFDEGKCFEIKATIPKVLSKNYNPIYIRKGIMQTWILCTDNDRAKSTLLSNLLKKKLKMQRARNAVITLDRLKTIKKGKTSNFNFGKKNIIRGKPENGYWILLQDWTECTLRCGGGKSYQHWMCVPPKNNGKPCRGRGIKERDCNTQKCPHISIMIKRRLHNLKKAEEQAAKPMIVQVARLSTRLQRYSKCSLKENDAYLTEYNIVTKEVMKRPIRLVMNNQTVTIFSDEYYENKIYTFNLDNASIQRNGFCCVRIRDTYRAYQLCGLAPNCGTRLNNRWAEGWMSDFNLFKYKCTTKRQISRADGYDENDKKNIGEMFDEELSKTTVTASTTTSTNTEIQKEAAKFQRKMQNKIQNKVINLKEKKILKTVRKNEKKKGRARLLATQNAGLNALVKENELENLVAKEEKDREARVMSSIIKSIRKEKKKRKCLKNNIKKKQLDVQIQMEKRDAEKEVKEAKEEVKMEIAWKRKMIKRQIAQMRKKARRRRAALQSKLKMIRVKMARDIMESNRDGDMMLCKKGKYSQIARDNYCDINYRDDYIRNTDCKDQNGFCYMCCEHEFGNNFLDDRNECYDMCDGNSSGKQNKRKKFIASQKKKAAQSSNSSSSRAPKNIPLGGWVWRKFSNRRRRPH